MFCKNEIRVNEYLTERLSFNLSIKRCLLVFLFTVLVGCSHKAPIASGSYVFQHRYAEHPTQKSISLHVEIKGSRIKVTNYDESKTWPKGLVEEGNLFLHSSGKWIIIKSDDDKKADEVGGCTDGPTVVNLTLKQYWTC